VSSNFVHSTVLVLKDASVSGSPYSSISISVGSQTSLPTASSGVNLTRYLGLFVSNLSGGGAFTGADNATLTYTLSVP